MRLDLNLVSAFRRVARRVGYLCVGGGGRIGLWIMGLVGLSEDDDGCCRIGIWSRLGRDRFIPLFVLLLVDVDVDVVEEDLVDVDDAAYR